MKGVKKEERNGQEGERRKEVEGATGSEAGKKFNPSGSTEKTRGGKVMMRSSIPISKRPMTGGSQTSVATKPKLVEGKYLKSRYGLCFKKYNDTLKEAQKVQGRLLEFRDTMKEIRTKMGEGFEQQKPKTFTLVKINSDSDVKSEKGVKRKRMKLDDVPSKSLREENLELKKEVQSKITYLQHVEEDMVTLEELYKKLVEDVGKTEKRQSELEQKLQDQVKHVEEVSLLVSQSSIENNKFKNLQKELEDLKKEMQEREKLKQIRDLITGQEGMGSIKSLIEEEKALRREESVESSVLEVEGERRAAERRLKAAEEEVAGAVGRLKAELEQKRKAESELGDALRSKEAALEELKKAEEERESVESELRMAREHAEAVEAELKACEEEREASESSLSDKMDEINLARGLMEEAREKRDAVEVKLRRAEKECEEMRGRLRLVVEEAEAKMARLGKETAAMDEMKRMLGGEWETNRRGTVDKDNLPERKIKVGPVNMALADTTKFMKKKPGETLQLRSRANEVECLGYHVDEKNKLMEVLEKEILEKQTQVTELCEDVVSLKQTLESERQKNQELLKSNEVAQKEVDKLRAELEASKEERKRVEWDQVKGYVSSYEELQEEAVKEGRRKEWDIARGYGSLNEEFQTDPDGKELLLLLEEKKKSLELMERRLQDAERRHDRCSKNKSYAEARIAMLETVIPKPFWSHIRY